MKNVTRPTSTVKSYSAAMFIVLLLVTCIENILADERLTVNHLSHQELAKVVNNASWVLVDARATDAFNGWSLDGMRRGGHIPGAVDFSANWLDLELENQTQQLKQVLATKGIVKQKQIVVYSAAEAERRRIAELLVGFGYPSVYQFDLREWEAADGALDRYVNYQYLLPASILKRLIDGERPETLAAGKRLKLVEVSWGDENASYAQGHVPGSFHVNTDHFEPPPTWYLGDRKILTKFANDYGFQHDDMVIVSGADVTASYRLSVVLQYMGIADVRVLNGGLAAWKRAGFPVEMKRHDPPKSAGFGVPIPQHPQLIVDTQYVKAALRNPETFSLIDTRTWAEFVGDTSGYKTHPHKGRIPGSTYGQANFRGVNSLSPYRNLDDTMRNADEILGLWKTAGISTDKHLCFFCGGGWRAAEVLMFARVIGLQKTSLYSDGWIGWSNDPKNPTEIGLLSKAKKNNH